MHIIDHACRMLLLVLRDISTGRDRGRDMGYSSHVLCHCIGVPPQPRKAPFLFLPLT